MGSAELGATVVAMLASSKISLDERAALPTEPDQIWIRRMRTRVRVCFWGGLAMTITAAILADN